jgi:hypothetical protein
LFSSHFVIHVLGLDASEITLFGVRIIWPIYSFFIIWLVKTKGARWFCPTKHLSFENAKETGRHGPLLGGFA